ncbi:MAG: Histone transcription regulator 3 [Pycnora praestabilis]|nr:MAG: Histone transcription regulator 3 [Pycnora praestabilis]
MATFTALNELSDADEDSDDEVDDTKEIQIEEALKLYQNALKLHSQGPQYYGEAAEAYQTLWRSEIFQYPESLSRLRRYELYGALPGDKVGYYDDTSNEPLNAVSGADGISNTLPQILYLSYKNYAQFKLDSIAHGLDAARTEANQQGTEYVLPKNDLEPAIETSLRYCSDALEKDDTDLELWRKTSRIGSLLGSRRIARFCLEAILDGEDEGRDLQLAPLGLEDGFAKEELMHLMSIIDDELSMFKSPKIDLKHKRLSVKLKKHMDPYPRLPISLGLDDPKTLPLGRPPIRHEIHVINKDWTVLGTALLQHLVAAQQGRLTLGAGTGILIVIPDHGQDTDVDMHESDEHDGAEAQIQGEIAAADSKNLEPGGLESGVNDFIRSDEDLHTNSGVPNFDGLSQEETAQEGIAHQGLAEETITISLPSRKRSSASAGMEEPADSGRIRSKRIRARESVVDTGANEDMTADHQTKQLDEHLQQRYTHANHWLFEIVGSFLQRLDVGSLGSFEDLETACFEKDLQKDDEHDEVDQFNRERNTAVHDFFKLVQTWDDNKRRLLLYGHGSEVPGGGALVRNLDGSHSAAGLTAFFEHSKNGAQKRTRRPLLSGGRGITDFAKRVNSAWLQIEQVSLQWLECLLRDDIHGQREAYHNRSNTRRGNKPSKYISHKWPDVLKDTVVQMLVRLDNMIYCHMQAICDSIDGRILDRHGGDVFDFDFTNEDLAHITMAETIFEIHFDVYASITNPSSKVDLGTRMIQQERLSRWARLASDVVNLRWNCTRSMSEADPLTLRYMWTASLYATWSADVSREHVLLCMTDLKNIMQSAGDPMIELQNNAVMPEVSASAAEREISRMATMDFFDSIFSNNNGDALAIIESLEPVLDSSAIQRAFGTPDVEINSEKSGEVAGEKEIDDEGKTSTPPSKGPLPPAQNLIQLLENGGVSLKVFLWQRLREAYETIQYLPKVFSCSLRSIELIMREFKAPAYLHSSIDHRQLMLLRWLKDIDDILAPTLLLALNEPTAYNYVDSDHLVSSTSAVAELARLLFSFTLFEDRVCVEHIQVAAPSDPASAKSFALATDKLHDMQLQAWTLLYTLLKEGAAQNKELFPTKAEDFAEYLRWVHYSMGIRCFCKASDKLFLKYMKAELLRENRIERWENDLAQVVYDLYGFKLLSNMNELQEHRCPTESLDRNTAIQLMDFVMMQVVRVNLKDLPKTDLKLTIDKMQQVIGAPQVTSGMSHNKMILNAYLRSSINPVGLINSLNGIGELSSVPVLGENSLVAAKGWYILLGHMALVRFRTQKRVSAGPTDDLDFARGFFRRDLEYSMERWETWYRMAQVYDSKLEEDVLWSAEKINNNSPDLVEFQRHSIHCYMMALATAIRWADTSFETVGKISELYTDFGIRIYASSRAPFSMGVFKLTNYERHFSGPGQGTHKKPAHTELDVYSAWKFASVLFKRALVEKPNHWMNHYMLGKCLWKMSNHESNIRHDRLLVAPREPLEAFIKSVKTVPERKDSRQEPIIEPHYKLVSIVHKMVQKRRLSVEEGARALEATPYARKIPSPSEDPDMWEPYILQILKALRTADKANWHHRMIARAAHVIYDDSANEITAAMGAKHEFTQQIFTKTMALQVWKPEFERAGRHFVYTSTYILFFSRLLVQLNDRAGMESLVKRARKRASDFVNHSKIWQEICLAYLKLLRRIGQVPEAYEDTVFKSINHDDFQIHSSRLESWCHLPTTQSSTLDILRDIIELKKLNNGLMKATLIDDLIADTYAKVYEAVVPELIQKINGEENRERMSLTNLLMSTDGPTDTPPPPTTPSQNPIEPGVRPRAKGVGRRELQRKAETAVTKPLPTPITARPPRVAETITTTTASSQQAAPAMQVMKDEVGREEAGQVGSSVPGSVHDSADDESELSEIDEEMVIKPLFPNLVSSASTPKRDEVDGEKPAGEN